MFFSERIKSILPSDKVLEIGPGGTPHPRANVLLEKRFDSGEEEVKQRGLVPALDPSKSVVFYDGGAFPFKNNEFDYVICSHVVEHVDDVDGFVREVCRVGKKGYMEFPTIYYEYLYNFTVHKNFVLFQDNVLKWLPKIATPLNYFFEVHKFFYTSLAQGKNEFPAAFKPYLFQGFEWKDELKTQRVDNLEQVCLAKDRYIFSTPQEALLKKNIIFRIIKKIESFLIKKYGH